jgi:hypothetical protein
MSRPALLRGLGAEATAVAEISAIRGLIGDLSFLAVNSVRERRGSP